MFGTLAIAASVALVCAIFWLTRPGLAQFNAFNKEVFGQLYTAGAIAMILFYGLVFVASVGFGIAAAVYSWIRRESPRWVTWAAIAASLVAPVLAVNLLKSA